MMNKSKLVTGIFFAACLFSSALLAQSSGWSWSRGTFSNVGVVGQIRHNSIILDDAKYRLSPTVKFTTVKNIKANIDLLKVSHMVGFNIISVNKRLMVDHIWLIPENERLLYRPQL